MGPGLNRLKEKQEIIKWLGMSSLLCDARDNKRTAVDCRRCEHK